MSRRVNVNVNVNRRPRTPAQQKAANERKRRLDAIAARTQGHVSARTADEVEHERYMRSMGL